MAEKNNFQNVVEALMKGMDGVLSAKTVVGEPTQIGDTIIVPLVDISFGVGAGASCNSNKGSNNGTGGLGGKMTPSAVLVIHNGNTKLVNIKNQDTLSKVLDMIPEVVDKITKPKDPIDVSDEQAKDIAFPEDND